MGIQNDHYIQRLQTWSPTPLDAVHHSNTSLPRPLASLISQCCAPISSCFDSGEKSPTFREHRVQSPPQLEHNQPTLTPFPSFPVNTIPRCDLQEVGLGAYTTRSPRSRSKSTDTMRSVLAAWKRQRKQSEASATSANSGTHLMTNSSNRSVRTLKISAPTNFVHVSSQSHLPHMSTGMGPSQTPMMSVEDISVAVVDLERPPSFHPLELSIHENSPSRRMSPILPIQWPETQPASSRLSCHHTGVSLDSCDDANFRAMSFHMPRRPFQQQQVDTGAMTALYEDPEESIGDDDSDAPSVPIKSRKRAYTSPETEAMVNRIASALIEKERLDQAIEDAIERESIYLNSRPSTAHSQSGFTSLEPMPTIPVMPPPAALSFSDRIRPATSSTTSPAGTLTAPSAAVSNTLALQTYGGGFTSHGTMLLDPSPTSTPVDGYQSCRSYTASPNSPITPVVLTAPLPLVLRPPLRKKQAFQRVSSWLFVDQHGVRDSIPSVSSSDTLSWAYSVASSTGPEARQSPSASASTARFPMDARTMKPTPLVQRGVYDKSSPGLDQDSVYTPSHGPFKSSQRRNEARDQQFNLSDNQSLSSPPLPRSETTWLSSDIEDDEEEEGEDDLATSTITYRNEVSSRGVARAGTFGGFDERPRHYTTDIEDGNGRTSENADGGADGIVTPAMVVPVVGVAF